MGVIREVTGGEPARFARPLASIFARPIEWVVTGARWRIVAGCGAALAIILAVISAHQAGFPLDDSWIHQDFARTLATTHQFAYSPGRSGAGSTSPIWVLLLTPPYVLFGATPPLAAVVGWTALLGAAALAALAVLTGLAAAELAAAASANVRTQRLAAVVASLSVATEWHLVWAAASGMETVLFSGLVMGVLLLSARRAPAWILGLLTALSVGVRPEGAALVVVVGAGSLWAALWRRDVSQRLEWLRSSGLQWALPFVATFLLAVTPYLVLNVRADGHIVPSTIAAKAAYYGGGGFVATLAAYVEQVAVVMLGSSPVVVLLGVLSYSHRLQTSRRLPQRQLPESRPLEPARLLRWLLIAWPLLLLVAYAGRLPVLYHNGRYLMPALPPLLALGAAGAIPLLIQWRRALSRVGLGLLVLAGAFSLVRGAQIYSDNVRFINACQVDTALWLRTHTPHGSLIATHDIGAIGYFSQRPVLDIAGLVDPQITPYLADQTRLEAYIKSRRTAYVVEFTDWFGPPNTLLHDLARGQVYRARGSARFVVMRTEW
jgi:hypothetical protein